MLLNQLKSISLTAVLFCLLFSIYSLFVSGWIQFGDDIEKYRVAQSIVERQQLSIRPTAMRNNRGTGGETYSIYELGQSVLQIPLYSIGKVAYSVFPVPDPNWLTMLFVGLLNPLLTALSGLVLFKICAMLGFRHRTALALSLVFGLGTIVFPYSRSFTREPLLTLLILSSVGAAYAFRETRHARWLLICGATTGYLGFTKSLQAIVIPLILGYLLAVIVQDCLRNHNNPRLTLLAALRGTGLFLLPNLVFLALGGIFAMARYGTIFSGMANPNANPIEYLLAVNAPSQPLVAAIQLFISHNKSLFLYSPPVCLFLLGWFQWVRRHAADAILAMLVVVVEFLIVILRYDWDGGFWWGPRYLVQIVPLLMIPIGFLLEASSPFARKFWWRALGILFFVGLLIQLVGALTNDRDYADTLGVGTSLIGQLDFLSHGAIDSMMFNLSPIGGHALQVNPYAFLIFVVVAFLCGWIIWRAREDSQGKSSWRITCAVLLPVFLIEFTAFVFWVVAPYQQVMSAKADTRLAAANSFLADGKKCQAITYYLMALDRLTTHPGQAAERIEQLLPLANGAVVSIDNPRQWIEVPQGASLEDDNAITISGLGAIQFNAVPGSDASVSITSQSVTAQPNTQYEMSGWMKANSLYGSGYGVVSIFEDDGDWSNGRTTDIGSMAETHGWQPFRKSIVTMPTTKRLYIKTGLYKTYGTFWVDGLKLVQVNPGMPPSTVGCPPAATE